MAHGLTIIEKYRVIARCCVLSLSNAIYCTPNHVEMQGTRWHSLNSTYLISPNPSFHSFSLPDVLCDPTDLIWRSGMIGTIAFIDGHLAGDYWRDLVNAALNLRVP